MLIAFDRLLDLPGTLESGQAFRWRLIDGWYHGVIFNNIIRIRQTAEGIEFSSAPDDEKDLEPLVRDYLRLNDDLDVIYKAINKDERISASVNRYPGLRILRQEPWECVISFICSANSNIRRISANVEDMSTSFGHSIKVGSYLRHAFPTPHELAEAGEQGLRQLGLGFRAKYVAAVARMVADGKVDLYSLREASYQESLDTLVALPGIGDKVGNCILLFSLDKLDAFPVDVWIDRALRDWYPPVTEKKLTRKAMRPWAQEYFGPFAGYANQYLFHGRRLQDKP